MEAQKAINDNTFNPNAPAFCSTDGSDKSRKMPLNGIFHVRRDSALLVGEPPSYMCEYLLMENRNRLG